MSETIKIPFYIRASLILIGAIAFLFIIYTAQSVIIPLVFALFIAILINPVMCFLVKKGINKVVAILLSILLVMIVLGAMVFFISLQITAFTHTFPQLQEKLDITGNGVLNWFSEKFNIPAQAINDWIKNTGNTIVKGIIGSIGHTLLTVGTTLVVFFLIPVYIFLILYYKLLLLDFTRQLFKVEYHANVVEVIVSINTIIRSYLTGLIIEGIIVAILNSLGLLILGIKYAIVLGIIGALLNVIPYIGGIIAIVLPMLIAFVTKSPISALWVLIVYCVIQFIDNHYLRPYIVASKVKINALVAIVVVLMGNLLCGIPGMFLSLPVTALVKVIFDHIEPLKPWGFLLGNNSPVTIKLPFRPPKKTK